MAERIAEIVILAENINQANFVRRILMQKGHQSFRVNRSPSGRGSGEQYVRERFPKEAALYRRQVKKRVRLSLLSLTLTRNPSLGVSGSSGQALASAGERARKPAEAIAVLVPKRHIETWVFCLIGERVDETTDYTRRKNIQGSIRIAAENFSAWSRAHYPVPAYCVPSLRRGLTEIQRIR